MKLLITNNVVVVCQRESEDSTEKGTDANGAVKGDAISQRLEQIYKRLELIDADSAESRAASILAVGFLVICCIKFIRSAKERSYYFILSTWELVEFLLFIR